ncbi:MAG: N-acetylmuramoyl-L-alanine amidase [Trueperaceae bacterium]
MLALALLGSLASAQANLVVNGRVITSNSTSLVPGSSYAAGAALAQALGATMGVDVGRGIALLETGGRVLQVLIVDDPASAGMAEAIWLDGRPVAGGAAVWSEGELFLPVKPVAEALGASVTYISGDDTVLVVQPRGRLTAMTRTDGRTERLELSISAPVRYTTFFNEPLSTLHIYLDRTDIELRLPPVEGEGFTFASATASGGATEVRVQLEEGVSYDVYSVPDARGFRLNVTFNRTGSGQAERAHVVLDAGHGGSDGGLVSPAFGSEAALTLAFAERLAAALRARGMTVTLTRDSDYEVPVDQRARAGIGADLFVSLHVADLPLGVFRAYYLGDAANVESLEMAVRENAATELRNAATDELRRRLLLGLVTDLDVGRRAAEGLAGRLFSIAGYRADLVAGAPLQVLGGAAGRGVLLEFTAADLASDGLPERLAEALDQLLSEGSFGPLGPR